MKLSFRGAGRGVTGSCHLVECGASHLLEVKDGGAMRKAILMMLMALVSSNALAEWVQVGNVETSAVYANPASIRRAGNRAKMWTLLDFKTTQQDSTNPRNGHLSEIARFEYKCEEQRARRLYYSWHSGNMGRDTVVSSDADPTKWSPVPRGTIQEDLWKLACGKP